MAKTITDKQAAAIKPGDKAKQSGITGLTLKPTKTKGRGKWNLRFVSPATGRRRDMGLGTYPDTTVRTALAQARKGREMIANDRDPIEARKAQQAIPTFELAARERWRKVAPSFRNAKHRQDWIRSLEMYAFPEIGTVRVDKLTPKDFADVLQAIWLERPETARRVKQRCYTVMAGCYAEGHTTGNPLDVVAMLLPKQGDAKKHQPAMPWRDVPAYIQAHLSGDPAGARAALLFSILTAARSGEVRGGTWREIDLAARVWIVPGERMKAGREHRVALSDAAVALLRKQTGGTEPTPDALIFQAIRGGMLSDMAVSSLLRKTNAPSDMPGRTATQHGFRASFRNWAADHGYSNDIAERALAHTIGNKVQAAYERTDRLDARVAMMQQWAGHVMGAGANVVALKA